MLFIRLAMAQGPRKQDARYPTQPLVGRLFLRQLHQQGYKHTTCHFARQVWPTMYKPYSKCFHIRWCAMCNTLILKKGWHSSYATTWIENKMNSEHERPLLQFHIYMRSSPHKQTRVCALAQCVEQQSAELKWVLGVWTAHTDVLIKKKCEGSIPSPS